MLTFVMRSFVSQYQNNLHRNLNALVIRLEHIFIISRKSNTKSRLGNLTVTLWSKRYRSVEVFCCVNNVQRANSQSYTRKLSNALVRKILSKSISKRERPRLQKNNYGYKHKRRTYYSSQQPLMMEAENVHETLSINSVYRASDLSRRLRRIR